MLISLPPVITKGEAKTTLFPWYVYPPVEPFGDAANLLI